MPRILSGKQAIKILCKDFGFSVFSQRGSHVKLRKVENGRKITTVIPLHKELAIGTLKGALELGEVNESDFWDLLKN